ncbi:T9SS type A sorting domain-containing protein [Marivirga sp.]|uniref:T9SS type A sorting domain-containing protein n=1 Tax=Marivirga sp. TaxID=2018662 RepID=UPI002D7F8FE7|nr:T9SS type A sorting domain-containing protein [Marivirga sp.]HET8859582.1 T9SS type A sorting domain-containing protein [Marivirga sp.]
MKNTIESLSKKDRLSSYKLITYFFKVQFLKFNEKVKIVSVLFIILMPLFSYSQDGSSSNPYTSLGMARHVTTAGNYYFNLSGTTFSTYVNNSGWVQVAIDFANSTGNLPAGTSLTNTTRGILNSTVLSKLTSSTEVRISSSTGNLDVITNNSTIISRVTSNTALSRGSVDNGINDFWTGTNSIYLTGNATCSSSSNNSLHQRVFHSACNARGFHWIPIGDLRREDHSAGEIPAGNYFQLWVRAEETTLPISLMSFTVKCKAENLVAINWSTASEINNQHFEIQQSSDGVEWKTVKTVPAAGNSSTAINYSVDYTNTLSGINYYRLKQVDFDGRSKLFSIVAANCTSNKNLSVLIAYPNPSKGIFYLHFDNNLVKQDAEIIIHDSKGITVYSKRVSLQKGKNTFPIEDMVDATGIHYVTIKSNAFISNTVKVSLNGQGGN